jgi:hypothetical protein
MPHIRRSISLALAGALGVAAFAPAAFADRWVDPDSLPPRARHFALHGNLGEVGPFREPARAGCRWSRMQVPTSRGLKWMAHEECSDDWPWR